MPRNFPGGAQGVRYIQRESSLDPIKLAKDRGWVVKTDLSNADGLLGLKNGEATISRRYLSRPKKNHKKGKGKPPKLKELAAATITDVTLESGKYSLDILLCSEKGREGQKTTTVRETKATITPSSTHTDWKARVRLEGMTPSDYDEAFKTLLFHIAKEADQRAQKAFREEPQQPLDSVPLPGTPRREPPKK